MEGLRRALAAHIGGLPSRFWWVWCGAFVSALATFVFLFLAVYLTGRGFDPQRVGLIGSCFGVGSLAHHVAVDLSGSRQRSYAS